MRKPPADVTRPRAVRVLTKSRKNEALIRNDGVYVISGIFCRANACVCGKNAFPSRPLAANRQICKRSGRFVGKPKVCQRFDRPRTSLVRERFLSSISHAGALARVHSRTPALLTTRRSTKHKSCCSMAPRKMSSSRKTASRISRSLSRSRS